MQQVRKRKQKPIEVKKKKKRIKVFQFADDLTDDVENPKESIESPKIMNESSKVMGCKINRQCTCRKLNRAQYHFNCSKENEILSCILNKSHTESRC